ncbi:efflux RND transporter periplasmic adaptor subunit [Magnetospirillum sp. SS-4]|uniref:efflux RND transporter periplasmic adaptor subunit n=1 Tax=Magnetospirillum sp. SS-4 TaxID=2681465 RepID=UPI001384FBF4|nr:efflux RND transporter periplasmic adaptor subunit [Magnetospirillum sp. SS-4]CAA7617585.1 Multidrug resistance protein MdtA [Magnetospirillum sp. SS-4]
MPFVRFKLFNLDRGAIVAAGVIAAVVAAAFLWPSVQTAGPPGRPGGADGRPVPVIAAVVTRKDVPIYLDALGTVQAYNTVTVRPRVDGELVEVLFKEGQDVRAGDVLAQIDPRTYRAQYEQAQAARDKNAAQLEAARRDLARYVSLGDRVTGQSVDTQRALVRQLEAALRSDEAAISNARTMLGYTVIASPIDGRAGMRLVDRGNIVRAADATGLVTLTQIQPISIIFTLPQQNLPAIADRLREGARLPVLAVQPDSRAVIETGELELIDNQIDQATGTIKLKAVMANAERRLWPGGFVSVRLLLDTRQGGLVIPAAAVQRGPQGPYVFVVGPDHTVDMRPVTVSTIEAGQALIESGVEEGETVVAEGVAKLAQGSRVATGGDSKGGNGRGKGGTP